jgi:hypothetical protein
MVRKCSKFGTFVALITLIPLFPIVAAGFLWWFFKASFMFGQDCARGLLDD